MQGFLVGGFCFAKKPLSADPYFQVLLSHILVGLTILNLQLTLQKYGRATIKSTSSIIIIIFHLLLCVTKNIKQSHAVRGGRFRIKFQPSQGNLDHTHGDRLRSRPRYFSPFFPVRGSGTPSPTTESDHSAPVRRDIKINPTSTRRVRDRSTRRSNQVLKLTDYHISRYVASTFKRLTK